MRASVSEDTSLRERVLLDLARRDKTNASDMFRGITEASARALGVARVGIWRLLTDRTEMICDDMFVESEQSHEHGAVRTASDDAAYFDDVLAGKTVVTPVRMDVPIWHRGMLYGVVSHDQQGAPRHWDVGEIEFANNLADVAALTLEASERQDLEHRWATVIDGIAELIMVLDRDGRVVQSNARSQALIDRLSTNGVTLVERMQVLVYRDLNGYIVPFESWPGPRALRGEHVREVIGAWHHQEGFLGYYRTLATPIFDGREITGCVCVLSDVTEDVQFERLKAEFLSRLAYEMKAPVTTVKSNAEHLLRDKRLGSTDYRKLAAIERGSRRMERLIDDVIESSVLARGRVTLVREPVEIRGLIEAEVKRMAQAAYTHRFHIAAPQTADLLVDRVRIERVMRRLLDNAVRYSPAGDDIDVELDVDDQAVVVSVRDRGIGIPADKRQQIFDMFFRAHARTAHDVGGLGLGLYLSREVARLHGGDLWFDSSEGHGSTFYLRLPREVRP